MFDFQRDILYLSERHSGGSRQSGPHPSDTLASVTDTESFARVRNIAFSVNYLYYRRDRNGIELTAFLIDVLEIFTNLKNFTFVLKHDRMHESHGSYTFADPIVTDLTLVRYRNAMGEITTRSGPREVANLCPKFDLKEVERQRLRCIQEGRGGWRIPNVHYKVAVPQSHMNQRELASGRF